MLVDLNPYDKEHAFNLGKEYGINKTYFDLGLRYMAVPGFGKKEGLDFSGVSYLAGVTFEF